MEQENAKPNAASAALQALREKGNQHFAKGEFQQALEAYTRAVDHGAEDAALFSNRAATYLKLGDANKALDDAGRAIQLRPEWEKGYYRWGCAMEQRGNLDAAALVYQRALDDVNPDSAVLRECLKQVKQKIKKADEEARAHFAKGEKVPLVRGTTGWAGGLSEVKAYEWLVDSYRVFAHAHSTLGSDYQKAVELAGGVGRQQRGKTRAPGGQFGGAGLEGEEGEEVAMEEQAMQDFLVFCKLAVERAVVFRGWNWAVFLRTAARLLPEALPLPVARAKWEGPRGEGLMTVAQSLYGGTNWQAATKKVLLRGGEEAVEMEPGLFREVGGIGAWKELLQALAL